MASIETEKTAHGVPIYCIYLSWLPYKQRNQLMAYPFTVYIYHGFHRTRENSSWLTHSLYIFIMASIEPEKPAHGLPIHCLYLSWLP